MHQQLLLLQAYSMGHRNRSQRNRKLGRKHQKPERLRFPRQAAMVAEPRLHNIPQGSMVVQRQQQAREFDAHPQTEHVLRLPQEFKDPRGLGPQLA